MKRVYQIWVLPDDSKYADEHQRDLSETKMIETENRDVAMWFAATYPFTYVENSLIRIEYAEIDDNNNQIHIETLCEFPLTK